MVASHNSYKQNVNRWWELFGVHDHFDLLLMFDKPTKYVFQQPMIKESPKK
jgi:hypothetical protein